MEKKLLALVFLVYQVIGFAQEAPVISGRITDQQTSEALDGASVSVKGSANATETDREGHFILQNATKGRIVLVVSHIGYTPLQWSITVTNGDSTFINLSLIPENRTVEPVVISASRRVEKITNAPTSIQVISMKDLEQFAGSNVTELVSKVQGVEYTRAGVDDITFNARGLHSAFNNKVFQLVDGRNSMASASAGLALFNNGSTIKDDIEQIEILLGPQSALYGPNAHNALFNYITKDPRKYPGTSISSSVGSQSQFSTRFRHAVKINEKWAYKVSAEHATGKDYEWRDSVYAGNGTFFGPVLAIPERIPDFSFKRNRGEAHVYYSLTPKTDIIVSGGGSQFTRLQVTTATHNQLRDVSYGFMQARLVHPRFFANVYNTWGNLGHTIFLGSYTRDFWNRTHSSLTTGPNRYLPPDSAEIFATRLGNTVKEKSQRLNGELQYNYSFSKAGLWLVTGLTFQQDRPNGFGFTLIDSFEKIRINQYGAVVQLDKTLPLQLRLVSTVRYDHHSNFGGFVAPRFALLKNNGEGTFRVTWGRAYAMPSIQQQYAGINGNLFGNGAGIYYIPNGARFSENSQVFLNSLKPEQVSTWEGGYKGKLSKKVYLDITYYNGLSKNFISPSRTVAGRVLTVNGVRVYPALPGIVDSNSILKGASFSTFFNYGDVRAYGIDAGMTYTFNRHISFALKYSWFGSDITEDNIKNDANNDGYVSAEERSLNAPQNRAIGILRFQNLYKSKFFLNLYGRYVQQYEFYSGNQIGTVAGKGKRGKIPTPTGLLTRNFDWGPLGGFTTFDLEAGYKLSEMVGINTSITNLLNTRQIEMVAAPTIGRLISVELKVQVP